MTDIKWKVDSEGYITLADYFGDKPHTLEQIANAIELLRRVNGLFVEYVAAGGVMTIDPDTGTYISGAKGGSGDGGFRTPESTTGDTRSTHRSGEGVDPSDQQGKLDEWLTDEILAKHGLYREHPDYTHTWCHLQSKAPGSGSYTYKPY